MPPATYAISSLFLTILSSATTLAAPRILSEQEFSSFVLLASFFQLAARFDFGLSERADQYGASQDPITGGSKHLIAARFLIAGMMFTCVTILIILLPINFSFISKLELLLTIAGGLLAMISVGPVTLARSRNDIRTFTILALSLQIGMTAPRFIGLLISGTVGCYSALLIWYSIFSLRALRSIKLKHFSEKTLIHELLNSFPLFIFSTLWLCYQFSLRWISALISSPETFSKLAFALNLLAIMTGTLTTIGQAFYPKFLVLESKNQRHEINLLFQKDSIILVSACFIMLAICLPFSSYGLLYFYVKHAPYLINILILSTAIIPLSLSLWFTPLILALSKRPLIDAALVLTPSFAGMFGSMLLGDHIAGATGQAIAISTASFIPLILVFVLLYHYKIASIHSVSYFIGLPIILSGILFFEIAYIR